MGGSTRRASTIALGLRNPQDLPIGAPGGHRRQDDPNAGRSEKIPHVEVPTEVQFGHGKADGSRNFGIGAGAGASHTGTLVIEIPPKVPR